MCHYNSKETLKIYSPIHLLDGSMEILIICRKYLVLFSFTYVINQFFENFIHCNLIIFTPLLPAKTHIALTLYVSFAYCNF